MATFPQPLISLALPPSPCPRCRRRQAQPEGASLFDLALTPSLVPGSKPGAAPKLSSHPDEKTSLFQRREC